jgi:hypothetical protein
MISANVIKLKKNFGKYLSKTRCKWLKKVSGILIYVPQKVGVGSGKSYAL